MEATIQELIDVLERLTRLYDGITVVLEREKAAATAADSAALEEIRLEKEPLLATLAAIEKERTSLVAKLSRAAGQDGDVLTLSQLAGRIGAPSAGRLQECRRRLKGRLEAAGRLNREVGDLLACGLRLVRGTITLVTQLTRPERVYHRSGRFERSGGSGRILSGTI